MSTVIKSEEMETSDEFEEYDASDVAELVHIRRDHVGLAIELTKVIMQHLDKDKSLQANDILDIYKKAVATIEEQFPMSQIWKDIASNC